MKKNLFKKRSTNFIHRVYRVSVPLKKFKKTSSLWHKKRKWTSRVLSGETLDDTRSTLRSTSTVIFKAVIPGNRCINVICTQSHKIASVEAIQSYSSANTAGGSRCCDYGFLTGSVHTVESGGVEAPSLHLRSFQSHVNTRNNRHLSADNTRRIRSAVAWYWRRSIVCCLCDKNNWANLFGHIKFIKVQWSNSRTNFENLRDKERECMFFQYECATALTKIIQWLFYVTFLGTE
jgi:hypothetical protein